MEKRITKIVLIGIAIIAFSLFAGEKLVLITFNKSTTGTIKHIYTEFDYYCEYSFSIGNKSYYANGRMLPDDIEEAFSYKVFYSPLLPRINEINFDIRIYPEKKINCNNCWYINNIRITKNELDNIIITSIISIVLIIAALNYDLFSDKFGKPVP